MLQFTVATTYDSAMYASDGAAASLGDEYAVARTRKPRAPAVIGRGSGEEPQKEDAAFRFKSLTPADAAVLDRFWSLRGVLGADKRQGLLRLGDAAMEEEQGQEAEASFGAGPDLGLCGVRGAPSEALMPHLSGAVLTWEETGDLVASERIREVSRRLLALHRVLGGESVDVAMMVFREPRLLDVNPASLTQVCRRSPCRRLSAA